LLSALLVMSAGMYIFKNADITTTFQSLGYPVYIIYPLAIAKILAVIALWTPRMPTLKEWTYSALFFEFLLALSAHLNVGDGDFAGALVAIILLAISYFTYKKLAS
ncbi:MAG: DoxX family protein, partial [Putridiphycobacter sp.]|nr:DoxX family protein [Putridiphycobacter sp.]